MLENGLIWGGRGGREGEAGGNWSDDDDSIISRGRGGGN